MAARGGLRSPLSEARSLPTGEAGSESFSETSPRSSSPDSLGAGPPSPSPGNVAAAAVIPWSVSPNSSGLPSPSPGKAAAAADRSCACALWGQEMLLPGGAGHARGKHSEIAGFIAARTRPKPSAS